MSEPSESQIDYHSAWLCKVEHLFIENNWIFVLSDRQGNILMPEEIRI